MACDSCDPCKIVRYAQMLQQQHQPPNNANLRQHTSQSHYFYTERVIDADCMKKYAKRPRSCSVENVKTRKTVIPNRPSSLDSPRKNSTDSKKSVSSIYRNSQDSGSSGSGSLPRARPSSAESRQSYEKNKNRPSSETAATRNKKTKSKSTRGQSVEELRKDLSTIKEQLCTLAVNREEAVEVTNELRVRYKRILEKNTHQEEEIECLKRLNQHLACQVNELKKTVDLSNVNEIAEAKKTLDDYGCKLSELYSEFLDAASSMEGSKEEIAKCLKQKEGEFRQMELLKNELCQRIEEKDAKFLRLMRSYTKLKECQQQNLNDNQHLTKTVEQLQKSLNEQLDGSQKLQNDAADMQQQQQQNQKEREILQKELLEKDEVIKGLNATVDDLRDSIFQSANSASELEDLQLKYEQLCCKYKTLLAKFQQNEEKDKSRFKELECFKGKEQNLCNEVCRLKKYTDDLAQMVDESKLEIRNLKSMHQKKDEFIQCQTMEINAKQKEIECLRKNLDKLRHMNSRLVDCVGSKNVPNKHPPPEKCKKKNLLYASDHCCVGMTNELQELVGALYEEIDKVVAKDEEIEKQNRNICCLKCALGKKEKELYGIKSELRVVQEQLKKACQEKESLMKSLKKLESQLSTDFDEECECGCGGEEYDDVEDCTEESAWGQ